MKMLKGVNPNLLLITGLAVGGYLIARQAGAKAAEVVEDTANAINPVNSENIFAGGVNAVGDALDNGNSDGSFSLGGSIYEFFHGDREREILEGGG